MLQKTTKENILTSNTFNALGIFYANIDKKKKSSTSKKIHELEVSLFYTVSPRTARTMQTVVKSKSGGWENNTLAGHRAGPALMRTCCLSSHMAQALLTPASQDLTPSSGPRNQA